MTTSRLDLRLDQDIKDRAEKASALLGMKSLTEYVVKLMDDSATQVIEEYESMTLENDIFDRFVEACDKADKPNKALKSAVAFTQQQGY
ncbi:MAG: DUF1778 domain-containing protein [Cocleimonas sp.]